jgi:hypothetical protein
VPTAGKSGLEHSGSWKDGQNMAAPARNPTGIRHGLESEAFVNSCGKTLCSVRFGKYINIFSAEGKTRNTI